MRTGRLWMGASLGMALLLAHALATVATFAAALQQAFRSDSMSKPLHAGRAAEAGVTPVTYASGKSKSVAFRWACNHRLRRAITCLADNSRHASAWAAAIYANARARGCRHPHAIRILARAWLRVIWRAWLDRKPYDPASHGGLQTMLKTEGG